MKLFILNFKFLVYIVSEALAVRKQIFFYVLKNCFVERMNSSSSFLDDTPPDNATFLTGINQSL